MPHEFEGLFLKFDSDSHIHSYFRKIYMTAVTVKRFAEQIGVSEERLLEQLKNAGVLDKTIEKYSELDDIKSLLNDLEINKKL